jgi:small-conductance mechanosensitive channel
LELKRIQARVQLLREELSKRRQAEAERAKQETAVASRVAEGRHALVGELAAANAKLSEQLSEASAAQGQPSAPT